MSDKHDAVDVIELRYREVYAAQVEALQQRRHSDPAFGVDDLRGFLKDAYRRQDNVWFGEGALYDAVQSATVAAYEAVLAEWQGELNEKDRAGSGTDEA